MVVPTKDHAIFRKGKELITILMNVNNIFIALDLFEFVHCFEMFSQVSDVAHGPPVVIGDNM